MNLEISKDTQLCISLSARPSNFGTRFQNFLFQKLGLNFVYKAFGTHDLAGALSGIRALGIRGSAVSMPFKEQCIPYLDELDPSALIIQSVNTIVNTKGHLKGYNTDSSAVLSLLRQKEINSRLSFAVLGSGGMAKAVLASLKNTGFEKGWVIARNSGTGIALASHYGYLWKPAITTESPDFLINTTPIGMEGSKQSSDLAFPEALIQNAQMVFDVVAMPTETPLIRTARTLGKPVITGDDVIVLQAVEQFILYTGVTPPAELIAQAAAHARSI